MTKDSKEWLCPDPSCPYRSSRRGNMIVHMRRWRHGSDREPIYLGDQTQHRLKCKKFHQHPRSPANKHPSNPANNTPSSGGSSFLFRKPSSASKKPDSPFEPINNLYDHVVEAREIPRKIEEIKSFFSGSSNTNKSLWNIDLQNFGKPPKSYTSLPPFNLYTLSPSFTSAPTIDAQGTKKEKVAGFEGSICDNCMETVIETQYGVDENGKEPRIVKENSHIICCGPLKPLTLERAVIQIINYSAKLRELPYEVRKAVKIWTGQDTYLVALKLPPEKAKGNIIDIYVSSRARTNNNSPLPNSNNYSNKDNKEWALRAAKNVQIKLNDDDLIDFIRLAQNKTSAFFRIHIGNTNDKANIDNSCLFSGIYCMFIIKGSSSRSGSANIV